MSNEGPGAVFDAHVRAEFVERSVDATMATMTDAPYVTHVPVMTGGHGLDEGEGITDVATSVTALVHRRLGGRLDIVAQRLSFPAA